MWAHVTAAPRCKQSRYACAHHITQAGIGQTVQCSPNSSNLRQNHIELSQFSLIQIISFFSSAIFALTFAQAHSQKKKNLGFISTFILKVLQCLHKNRRKRNPNEITDYFVCTANAHAWMSYILCQYAQERTMEKCKTYNGSEP